MVSAAYRQPQVSHCLQVRAGFDLISAANDVAEPMHSTVAAPAAQQAGPLLAAAVRALMEFPRPLEMAAELAQLATGDRLAVVTAHRANLPENDAGACGEAAAFNARIATLRAALHSAVRDAEVEGPGGAAAARAEALMLEALAVWRRLRAEQERAAAEEATLFKTKTRANSILSETVWRGGVQM